MHALFLIGIGSAIGGITRFLASRLVAGWLGEDFPWGTLVINVTGSFVIGFYFTLIAAKSGRLTAS